MKKIFFFTAILVLNQSCNKTNNIDLLAGYWEISSVSLEGNELKNYPFSNTVDYFEFNEKNSGFRKKVKPKMDGNFNITMHQIDFKLLISNGRKIIEYGKGDNFKEEIIKLDSLNLFIENNEGYIYKYKRFTPKNYLDG